MDSFSGKPTVRCQLGRHLAETPYTSSVLTTDGAAGASNQHRNVKSEPSDGELRRTSNASGADSANKRSSRDYPGASGSSSGPRFVDAPVMINDGDGAMTHFECGEMNDDGESNGNEGAKHSKGNRRVLTQRYQLDQMRTIRKRISTEDWICEQLDRLSAPAKQTAHGSPAGQDSANTELIIDLDELLACGGDSDRRAFLEMKLRNCPAPSDDIETFINECIEKIRPL